MMVSGSSPGSAGSGWSTKPLKEQLKGLWSEFSCVNGTTGKLKT